MLGSEQHKSPRRITVSSANVDSSVTKRTGKSSKILKKLMNRLNSNKLADMGLNRMIMEEVKNEINEQMRQNKTTYHITKKMPEASMLPLDKEGTLTLLLVNLSLYNHCTLKLRLLKVDAYL